MNPGIGIFPLNTFIYLLVLFSIHSCQSKTHVTEVKKKTITLVHWEESDRLSEVVDKAIKTDRLIFLNIVTDWCLPCKMMDQDVFSDKPIANYLNQNFINYKVDAEKENGPDLKYLYEVNTIPTLLFLDHKGRIVLKHEGSAYHLKLRNLGDEALRLKS